MKTIVNLGKTLTFITLVSLSLGGANAISAAETNSTLTQNRDEYRVAQARCTSELMMVMTPEGGPLKVRDRRNINAKVIAMIPNGSVVLRKGWDETGNWANIITDRGNGFEGWVWASYLSCGAD